MVYTATQLITEAYQLSSVVSKGYETVGGDQLTDGLQLLNAVLAIKSANKSLIPYFSSYDFPFLAGVEEYFIPKLVELETLVFFLGTVRYSMIAQSRREFFGSPRAENIENLPGYYRVERTLGGSNIFLYFVPNVDYPAKITGRFSLENISLNQDLSLALDAFYIEYLRYALASYICEVNTITFPMPSAKRLTEYENMIRDISPVDLTMSKMSTLNRSTGINYGDVNIGHQWRP